MYWCPEVCISTQKSTRIWKVYLNYSKSEKSRFFYISITWQLSLVQPNTRLSPPLRVSRAQPRSNAYEILLQHDWLLFFSRHYRFAETHSHLQLSCHITDRLLAACNNTTSTCSIIQILYYIHVLLVWILSYPLRSPRSIEDSLYGCIMYKEDRIVRFWIHFYINYWYMYFTNTCTCTSKCKKNVLSQNIAVSKTFPMNN